MSVTETIIRYHLIIAGLKKHPMALNEVMEMLHKESEFRGFNLVRDKRTFHRDLDAIRSIYDIDVQFNFQKGVYEIVQSSENDKNIRMVEALDLFSALKVSENISGVIHFEKRRPSGSEYLSGLLHAMRDRYQVKISYQKYWEDYPEIRDVEPHALKEYKHRWYLLATDTGKGGIRIFALDRISSLMITNRKFQHKVVLDMDEFFRYCFGIIVPNDEEPQTVVLSFDPYQGKYIKSLPLHHSQVVLTDSAKEVRVQLKVYLTFDFIMEILSFGSSVEVIKPKELVNSIKITYEEALNKYGERMKE